MARATWLGIRRQVDGHIAVRGLHPVQRSHVIRGLLVGELEPVRRRDHHDALVRADDLALDELAEGGEPDARVRAVEHARAVGARRLVGQLLLGGLLHHAVEPLERADGALDADRIADLDGHGERGLGGDRLEVPVVEERPVQRIGPLGLGQADARQPLDQPELLHHREPLPERVHVAEVAAGDHHPVRHLPVELLDDLDGDRLLALDAQAVHRVGQVDAPLLGDLLHHRHAAVEVRVEREHEGAVGERLHELGDRDLVLGQEHHRGNPRRRAVGAERGRGVARGGARHRVDGHAVGHHLLDDRDQHGHPQVLERAGVRVAALLDPQVLDVELLAVAIRPEEVRAALVGRHDVLVVDEGHHPFLLAPDARAVGVRVPAVALVEELHPRGGRARPQRLHVVLDLEEIAAGGAAVDDLAEAVLPVAAIDALKPRVVAHGAVQYSRSPRRSSTTAKGRVVLDGALLFVPDPAGGWPFGVSAGLAAGVLAVAVWKAHLARSLSSGWGSRPLTGGPGQGARPWPDAPPGRPPEGRSREAVRPQAGTVPARLPRAYPAHLVPPSRKHLPRTRASSRPPRPTASPTRCPEEPTLMPSRLANPYATPRRTQ